MIDQNTNDLNHHDVNDCDVIHVTDDMLCWSGARRRWFTIHSGDIMIVTRGKRDQFTYNYKCIHSSLGEVVITEDYRQSFNVLCVK